MSDINLLIGRIILGVYFVIFGAVFKMFNYEMMFKYMIEHNVPYTQYALILTIIIQLVCGVGIILGNYSKISAFVLALVTIIINYYMHDFWNMNEELEQRHEMQNFVKNTGIIAGLLILSAIHPGKYKLSQ